MRYHNGNEASKIAKSTFVLLCLSAEVSTSQNDIERVLSKFVSLRLLSITTVEVSQILASLVSEDAVAKTRCDELCEIGYRITGVGINFLKRGLEESGQ
jgi:hypothetical protein